MKPVQFAAVALALAIGSATLLSSTAAQTAGNAKTYDFKDPKGVNGIAFYVNSKLEPFFGLGAGVTGTIDYDPANPESFSGSISVDASTLEVSNGTMTDHMIGAQWVNAEEHPKITMTFDKVTKVEDGESGSKILTIDGKLQALGLSLDKTVKVTVSHIPDGAQARGGADSGDLLVLRSTFTVSRADLGIKPGQSLDKVGNEVGITVGIAGYEQ